MRKVLLIVGIFGLVIALPIVAVQAGGFKSRVAKEVVILPAGETVDRDFFAAGERVEISGTVNGDVYAAGGLVFIDGIVNGDVLVAGGQVTISGEVSDDVRVAGGEVSLSGQVGRNVTALGGEVRFHESATVSGNVVAASGSVILAGVTGGNAKLAAGAAIISGSAEGAVSAHVDELRLTSKASVGGDLTYFATQAASIDENAQIGGEIKHKAPVVSFSLPFERLGERLAELWLILKLAGFISFLALGLLVAGVYPNYAKRLGWTLRRRAWSSLGLGIALLVVVPVAVAILFATLVGTPLALILLVFFVITLYIAKLPVVIFIGRLIIHLFGKDKKVHVAWALLLGTIVYYLVTLIPVVGHVLAIIATVFGLGALTIAKAELIKRLRDKELV